MSSILDALNKLEKDVSPQDYPLANTRALRKAFISKSTILMAGVVCLCIGTIGFVVYKQMSPEKITEPLFDDVRSVAKSQVQKTPKPEATIDEQKPVLESSQKTRVSLPYGSQGLESMVNVSKPETVFSDDPAKTKPKPPEDESAEVEIKTESGPVIESKKEPVEKPVQLDRLEGVGLKIQAISWADTPQERLAVINNQVLREGDGIEGYQISHINPDDIVLRRGGKSYQLDFGLKGGP